MRIWFGLALAMSCAVARADRYGIYEPDLGGGSSGGLGGTLLVLAYFAICGWLAFADRSPVSRWVSDNMGLAHVWFFGIPCAAILVASLFD